MEIWRILVIIVSVGIGLVSVAIICYIPLYFVFRFWRSALKSAADIQKIIDREARK